MSKEKARRISRRDFVKGTVLGAGALAGASALAGCGPAAECPVTGVPEKWDKEVDVVVVGYGGAGASTAITAHDEGAKVLILEKAPEGRQGGTTRASANIFMAPPPGLEEAMFEYLRHTDYGDQIEPEIHRALAAEMMKVEPWVRSLGGEPVEFPYPPVFDVPGSEACRRMIVGDKGWGYEQYWMLLERNVQERGIEVLCGTPARSLVAGPEGEVLGVVAENEQGELYIKARRGVVLSTGGFEANPEMLKDYAIGYPLYYWGNPGNTGDGVRMAEALGAKLSHMNNIEAPQGAGLKVPDFDAVFLIGLGDNSFMYVNKFGERFINEFQTATYGWGWHHILLFDKERMTFPQIPWYGIFGQAVMDAGPLSPYANMGWNVIVEGYEWSADNQEELDKGWILKADSLSELANQIAERDGNEGKMQVGTLEAALNEYNRGCDEGEDAQFERPSDQLAPVSGPPYYAVELWPIVHATLGGPNRDANGRIVDLSNQPIPRLYSAGEMGSWWGSGYDGGVIEGIPSGLIAGRNVAAEEAWS
jgi:hypothetical protein